MEAVASGRNVTSSPFLSGKVYISFSTISVSSPILRLKSSVRSIMGIRISLKPKSSNIDRAILSISCHTSTSPGRMSLNPLINCIIRLDQSSRRLRQVDILLSSVFEFKNLLIYPNLSCVVNINICFRDIYFPLDTHGSIAYVFIP